MSVDENRGDAGPLLSAIYSLRWVTAIAVLFAGLGSVLMMVVGAVSTLGGIGEYFGAGTHDAFSEDAALDASIKMISSLDEFLLGLVLFIFAYGVYSLFIDPRASDDSRPEWFAIKSVTDLKVKLLETIAILLAVVFLKAALSLDPTSSPAWSDLVIPLAVGIFAFAILLIRRAR